MRSAFRSLLTSMALISDPRVAVSMVVRLLKVPFPRPRERLRVLDESSVRTAKSLLKSLLKSFATIDNGF